MKLLNLLQTSVSVENPELGARRAAAPVAAILAVGLLVTLPCWTVGLPGDQDGPYHVDYQRSFTTQFWSGDLYPRWLPDLNAGLGTPIFYLQYPAPYVTAALLSPVLPVRADQPKAAVDLGVVAALSLIGSGVTAWFWFSTLVSRWPAALAAIAYMLLPYHFAVDLYTRSAIGENLAFVWLPLSMLFAQRIVSGARWALGAFALTYALLLMSHLFTALLFLPVPAAYCWLESPASRKRLNCAKVSASFALSIGVAGVYLFPLAAHRKYFDHRMLELDGTNNYNYWNHFAYVTEEFVSYAMDLGRALGTGTIPLALLAASTGMLAVVVIGASRIAMGSSTRRTAYAVLAASAILLFVAMPVAVPLWRAAGLMRTLDFHASIFVGKMFFTTVSTALVVTAAAAIAALGQQRRLLLLCTTAAAAAFFMSLPFSRLIWDNVPQLALMEFPWRFNTITTFSAAVLIAMALEAGLRTGRPARTAAGVLLVLVAAVCVGNAGLMNVPKRFLDPHRFPQQAGIEVLLRTYAQSAPRDWIRSNEQSLARRSFVELSSADARATYRREGVREVELTIEAKYPTAVRVKQLFYPTWQALSEDGSYSFQLEPSQPEGMLAFQVKPGAHRVRLSLEETASEKLGKLTSLAALAFTVGLLFVPAARKP